MPIKHQSTHGICYTTQDAMYGGNYPMMQPTNHNAIKRNGATYKLPRQNKVNLLTAKIFFLSLLPFSSLYLPFLLEHPTSNSTHYFTILLRAFQHFKILSFNFSYICSFYSSRGLILPISPSYYSISLPFPPSIHPTFSCHPKIPSPPLLIQLPLSLCTHCCPL